MEVKKIDGLLLGAVQEAAGFPNVPYDLRKVRVLEHFTACSPLLTSMGRPRDWLQIEPGEFGLIAEMPNLHTLLFPGRYGSPLLEVRDFSFLKSCKKLKKLDVSCTNFRDCSLLVELPALRWVKLPHKDQLLHTGVLDGLKASVEFGSKASPQAGQPVSVPAAVPASEPVSHGSEKIQKLAEEMRRLTGRQAYRLVIDKEADAGLFASKFGGLPYWTADKSYPADRGGKPMQLLAQLNLETLGTGEPLPQTGMLQFFAAQNDMFGCNFGDSEEQLDYRIVYHRTINHAVTPEQVRGMGAPAFEEVDKFCTPLMRVCAVRAELRSCYINDRAFDIEEVFRTAVKNAWGEETEGQPSFEYLDEDDYNDLFESLADLSDGSMNGGHWMLGYPNFTQDDPREPDGPYDTQLLQIDSVYDQEAREYDVLWGDCGVANFFISREDLANCDFSHVIYTWDCC